LHPVLSCIQFEGFTLANEKVTSGGLDITVDHGEEGAIVRLKGRLSIDSSPAFRTRLLSLLQAEPPEAVNVELTEAAYIDLSGIATLIEALKIARNHKTTLRVKGLDSRRLHLLEVTGLLPLFEEAGLASTQPTSRVI
jgi:anti-anti-sigma factor